jgi:simple sugar transport system permease protein/ribose transport system permease protein
MSTNPALGVIENLSGRLRTMSIGHARIVGPLLALLAAGTLILVAAITTPTFLTYDNILVIVRQASITGIMALGMTFITISGNFFSLSVEQTAAVSSIVFAQLMSHSWGLAGSLVGTLAVAAAIGAVQGGVISLGVNPIVTTLAAGSVLYGLAAMITGNQIIQIRTGSGTWIGQGRPLGIPTQSWAFVILTVVAAIVLSRARFGRAVTLVGANRLTARASGLRVREATILAFVVSALAAGVAGIFVASQIRQGLVKQFDGANIDVIAAVLIGGTAVAGGEGSMYRTAVGALFISLLTNYMILRNYSFGIRTATEGMVVVIAVCAFHLLRTKEST